MTSRKDLPLLSNIFFLAPVYMAVQLSIFWYSVVLVGLLLASTAHHYYPEHNSIDKTDTMISRALMLANTLLLVMGHFTPLIYSMATIASAIIAVYLFRIQKRNYDIIHTGFHIFSSLVCIFSLLTYRN